MHGRAHVLLGIAVVCICWYSNCSVGHPITGIVPQSENEDEFDPLSLALLATPVAAAAASGGGGGTTSASAIYMYLASSPPTNGDLRNGQPTARLGADLRCQTAPPVLPEPCGTTHAFISLTGTDEIRDMPANYGVPTTLPIYPPGGASLQLAANWTDLLNPAVNLDRSLTAAGLAGGGAYWSFSLSDGSLGPSNCSNGTSSAISGAAPGDTTVTNSQWLQAMFGQFCAGAGQLMCVCYN